MKKRYSYIVDNRPKLSDDEFKELLDYYEKEGSFYVSLSTFIFNFSTRQIEILIDKLFDKESSIYFSTGVEHILVSIHLSEDRIKLSEYFMDKLIKSEKDLVYDISRILLELDWLTYRIVNPAYISVTMNIRREYGYGLKFPESWRYDMHKVFSSRIYEVGKEWITVKDFGMNDLLYCIPFKLGIDEYDKFRENTINKISNLHPDLDLYSRYYKKEEDKNE